MKNIFFPVACTVAFSTIITAAPLWAAPKPALLGLAHWDANGARIWVVGGYDASSKQWLNDSAAQSAWYPGTNFGLFDLAGRCGQTPIDRAQLEEVPHGYFATARRKPEGQSMAVAIANVTNPMPRVPRTQSLENPIYLDAMTKFLHRVGWNGKRARLMQHYRVDLNGDGNEEVLLSAHSRTGMGDMSNARRGDYSAVALRFYDPTRKTNAVQIVPLQAEIVKRDIKFGAPEKYEILSCVDANGDGALEIVVRSRYYEGEGITVFAFDGHRVRQVLSAGWGV